MSAVAFILNKTLCLFIDLLEMEALVSAVQNVTWGCPMLYNIATSLDPLLLLQTAYHSFLQFHWITKTNLLVAAVVLGLFYYYLWLPINWIRVSSFFKYYTRIIITLLWNFIFLKVSKSELGVDKVFYAEPFKVLMLTYTHDKKLFKGIC